MWTSIILVTVVFGLFILAAILRIRNAWKELRMADRPNSSNTLRKLDLVFSSIFLLASLVFYLVFIVNLGR